MTTPDLNSSHQWHTERFHLLDLLLPEAGTVDITDQGFLNFEQLNTLRTSGVILLIITDMTTSKDYPQLLLCIKYPDETTGMTFNFLTNKLAIPAKTAAHLNRYRQQVALFFT